MSSWTLALKNFFIKIWFLWALSLLFNIITFLFIYYKIHPGNRSMALHYNVLLGVQWRGKGYNLYLIPAIALAINLLNFALYKQLKRSPAFFNFLTIISTLAVQLVLLFSVILLTRVN